MNNKFCKNCGQANLPNEKMCRKCGLNLPEMNSGIEDDPLKTIAVGGNEIRDAIGSVKTESAKKDTSKGSNKMLYWVLGGVGALILVSGFFIVALSAGIIIYASGEKDKTESVKTDDERKPLREDEEKNESEKETETEFVNYTDASIEDFLTKYKKRVGRFKLSTTVSPKKKYFIGSNAEQVAVYTRGGRKKGGVIINLATFETIEGAKRFVENKLERLEESGGKVAKHTDEKRKDSVIFNENGGGGEILECSEGLCIVIGGTSTENVADFYRAFFKK